MPDDFNAAILDFQGHYKDCGSNDALKLVRIAHKEILSRSQVRNVALPVSITEGVGEYDAPVGIIKIHEAYYEGAAEVNTWFNMKERSLDYFAAARRGWRMTTQVESIPIEYYVSSGASANSANMRIGVNPFPQVTTDVGTGYPRLRLYTTQYVDILGNDLIPTNLLSNRVYVYIMCRLWAAEQHKGDESTWVQVAEAEIDKNVKFVKNVQTQANDEIIPAMIWNSRTV